MAEPQINPGSPALCQQHGDDLARRAVAEQLPEGFFVIGDVMLFDQGDEVVLGVAGQGRFAEMRIVGKEAFRCAAQIGEIASPAAGDEDFLSRLIGVVQ